MKCIVTAISLTLLSQGHLLYLVELCSLRTCAPKAPGKLVWQSCPIDLTAPMGDCEYVAKHLDLGAAISHLPAPIADVYYIGWS